jgi:SAM-dependent methyltransferase
MTQVVSKKRVQDHGEVYTHQREVNAMLDLVKHETERIDSRFLEPACGTGNFLVEILNRKLDVVSKKYAKSQLDFERYAVLAIGSIYGIDLLPDNVQHCQERLFKAFSHVYKSLYKDRIKPECESGVKFILKRNILQGDALTLETVATEDSPSKPIVFSEWSLASGSLIKRRDFIYGHLVEQASHREMPLFSDLDEEAYIPEPIEDYPLMNFLEIANG